MKNLKVKALIIGSVVLVLLAAIYYYVALPAINIHSSGFWKFILFIPEKKRHPKHAVDINLNGEKPEK